jgi:hypothetical protein
MCVKTRSSIIFLMASLYSWVSCKSSSRNTVAGRNLSSSYDSIRKYIPRQKDGKPVIPYLMKADTEWKVGLESLENGYDSLQIRFWCGDSFSDKLQLVVINKTQRGWSAAFYVFIYHYDQKHDSVLFISREYEKNNRDPKSGWKSFGAALYGLKIDSLPDQIDIPDYQGCNDGEGVSIEFATTRIYRFSNYVCFRSQPNIWQAKNLEKILSVIEEQFGFTFL